MIRRMKFPQITEQKFHKSPNKSSTNNRTKVPQITENFQFSLVECQHHHLWQLSSELDSMPIKDKMEYMSSP